MICNTASTKGNTSSKVNVTLNFLTSSSHSAIPLRTSISEYQLLGTVSNICMNLCIHSCFGTFFQVFTHFLTWSLRSLIPIYLSILSFVPNLICISLFHYFQYFIPSLWVSHHPTRVSLSTTTNSNNLCYSGICSSNLLTKYLTSVNPSNFGVLRTCVPIQHKEIVMCTKLLVNTSCNLCF
jgi:hypothetical protein